MKAKEEVWGEIGCYKILKAPLTKSNVLSKLRQDPQLWGHLSSDLMIKFKFL